MEESRIWPNYVMCAVRVKPIIFFLHFFQGDEPVVVEDDDDDEDDDDEDDKDDDDAEGMWNFTRFKCVFG